MALAKNKKEVKGREVKWKSNLGASKSIWKCRDQKRLLMNHI
jgi:hypothetical protein